MYNHTKETSKQQLPPDESFHFIKNKFFNLPSLVSSHPQRPEHAAEWIACPYAKLVFYCLEAYTDLQDYHFWRTNSAYFLPLHTLSILIPLLLYPHYRHRFWRLVVESAEQMFHPSLVPTLYRGPLSAPIRCVGRSVRLHYHQHRLSSSICAMNTLSTDLESWDQAEFKSAAWQMSNRSAS